MDKQRYTARLTQDQVDRFERLLLELKLRRRVPQFTTLNRLLLILALERADELEAEFGPAKGRKR